MNTMVASFFSFQVEGKKKHKGKKNHREDEKCIKGRELTIFLSFLHLGSSAPLAFSSTCSFTVELSTFCKPCVSHLLEALCYSSLGVLLSSGDGMNGK